MKKLHVFFLVITIVLPVYLSAQKTAIPSKLIGKWVENDNTFIISKDTVNFIYNTGQWNQDVKWVIEKYDEANGYITGKIVSVISGGFDATSTYSDGFSACFSFTELTKNTVIISYTSLTITTTADLYTEVKKPEDVKFLGRVYDKVK